MSSGSVLHLCNPRVHQCIVGFAPMQNKLLAWSPNFSDFPWVRANRGTINGGVACVCANWRVFVYFCAFLRFFVRLFLPKWPAEKHKFAHNRAKMCKNRFSAIPPSVIPPFACHRFSSFWIRADFREGDKDSNFSIFRVWQFTEWPGPLHWIAFLRDILTNTHSLTASLLFTEKPSFLFQRKVQKCFVAFPSRNISSKPECSRRLWLFLGSFRGSLRKTWENCGKNSGLSGRAEKRKAYTTTTERKSFEELLWPQRKAFQVGGGYKNPMKTWKTMSTTKIFPVAPLEQGGVCFLFPSSGRGDWQRDSRESFAIETPIFNIFFFARQTDSPESLEPPIFAPITRFARIVLGAGKGKPTVDLGSTLPLTLRSPSLQAVFWNRQFFFLGKSTGSSSFSDLWKAQHLKVGWNGVWRRGWEKEQKAVKKSALSLNEVKAFSEWRLWVNTSTGKTIQWRGQGHLVNRRTLKIEFFCAHSRPKSLLRIFLPSAPKVLLN